MQVVSPPARSADHTWQPPSGFAVRPIQDADTDFLLGLYASTREDELRQVTDWTDEQKQAFIAMQFTQQHQQYVQNVPDAGYYVMLRGEERIGRIYIHWKRGNALHLMEVTLLPALRGQGIGTAFMRALMDEAARTADRMTLYVESFNPAYRLYTRLGFRPINEHGIYTLMEWRP